MESKPIPQDLIEHLEYRDGELYWNKTREYEKNGIRGMKKGNLATSITNKNKKRKGGPRKLVWWQVDGKWIQFFSSRVTFAMFYFDDPSKYIDHIDHDTLNDNIDNLRIATPSQNNQNQRKANHNTTGYKGVTTYIKKDGSKAYRGTVFHERKQYNACFAYTKKVKTFPFTKWGYDACYEEMKQIKERLGISNNKGTYVRKKDNAYIGIYTHDGKTYRAERTKTIQSDTFPYTEEGLSLCVKKVQELRERIAKEFVCHE